MNPGKIRERVRSNLDIANTKCLLRDRIRNVIMIAPRRTHEPELVRRSRIENQRGESREACSLIVEDRDIHAFKSAIRPAAGQAAIISEPVRVASKVQKFVRLIVAAIGRHELTEFGSFETRPWHDIEYSVAPISVIGAQAASLDLEILDILRIKLRPDCGEVTVWNGNAVDFPGDTMTTAGVEVVMH